LPICRAGCLFIHIPKCAGTSVEIALGVAEQYPDLGLRPTSTKPNLATLFGAHLQHLTFREICRNYAEVLKHPRLFSFSVVRDPVDRFISHFLWKHYRFAEAQADPKLINSLLEEIDVLVEQSRSLAIFDAPFEGLEYCEGGPQAYHLADIRRHLLPQCSYLFYRGVISIDAIYPITAIDALQRDLQRRGAIAHPIPQRMVGKSSKALRQAIPAAAMRRVQEIYRHDMHLYAQVKQISKRLGDGHCPGAAIEFEKPASGLSFASNRVSRVAKQSPTLPRKLWMYWHQGWDRAPSIVKKCAESWLSRNKSWEICFLDADILHTAFDIPDFYKEGLVPTLTAWSDVVRLHVLSQHGGVWADATTWCARPLNEWIDKVVMRSGFFAYAKPSGDPNRPISTWFLAAECHNHIANQLARAADEFWKRMYEGSLNLKITDDPHSRDYFWLHKIFSDLLKSDAKAAELWAVTPEISAEAPHYLQAIGLLEPVTAEAVFHICNKLTNIYKLDRRIDPSKPLVGTVLEALFGTL